MASTMSQPWLASGSERVCPGPDTLNRALALVLALCMVGCGGVGHMADLPASTPSFVNQTGYPDSDFQKMAAAKWSDAQQRTATQYTDLWANWRKMNGQTADPRCFTGEIACEGVIAPDARALNLVARGVRVVSVSDIPAGANTPGRTNPTGIIPCGPGQTLACQAFLMWPPCDIYVPASRPENMGPYEMQNCLLNELGYNTDRR